MAPRPSPSAEVRITFFLPAQEDVALSYPLDPRHNERLRDIHDFHPGEKVDPSGAYPV